MFNTQVFEPAPPCLQCRETYCSTLLHVLCFALRVSYILPTPLGWVPAMSRLPENEKVQNMRIVFFFGKRNAFSFPSTTSATVLCFSFSVLSIVVLTGNSAEVCWTWEMLV